MHRDNPPLTCEQTTCDRDAVGEVQIENRDVTEQTEKNKHMHQRQCRVSKEIKTATMTKFSK